MTEAKAMVYIHKFYDIVKRVFMSFYAPFAAQLLCSPTRVYRVGNHDNYRIEQVVQHEETGTCDITTQTEHDASMEFKNLPCFPIQYKSSMTKTLKSLVGNKWQSDVIFCIDNDYIAAHRLILAIRSNVFETMLYGFPNLTGRTEEIVFITDISMEVFRQLLCYIYTDHIEITHENVIDILYAAHKYNLSYLEAQCEEFIITHLTCGNVLPTMNHLFQFNAFDSIKSKLFDFVCDKFYSSFCTVDCLTNIDSIDLIKELLEKLVALDHKPDKGRFEFDLFNMLIQWAKVKTKELNVSDIKWDKIRRCLEGVEELINFQNMNAELLSRCVAMNPGFFTKDEIYQFFTHENFLSDSQFQRNNIDNTIDVPPKDNGFVFFGTDLNLMKAVVPVQRDELQ